jgi:Methyltransferase domain
MAKARHRTRIRTRCFRLDSGRASFESQRASRIRTFLSVSRTLARPNDNSGFSSVFDVEHCRSYPGDGERANYRIRHASRAFGSRRKLREALSSAPAPIEICGTGSPVLAMGANTRCYSEFPTFVSNHTVSLPLATVRLQRLLDEYSERSFTELVALYEQLLPTVSPGIRRKRQIHLRTGFVGAQNYLSEIRSYEPASAQRHFLEIGCGTGAFLVAAVQIFRCVVGLDLSMARLILARKRLDEVRCDATLTCAAAEALPFRGESFDVVAGSDVIEHVQEPRVMREAHRVLTPVVNCFCQHQTGGV